MGLSGLSWPVWLGLLDVTFTLQAKHRNLHQREKIQSRIGAGFPWLQRSCCKPLCGQVLSSGAWHGLCCPSLPLSSSLSVPKLPCAGSCAAPGVTAWQGLHSTPLARSQLGWLGSAGSTSVEGSGRSDSIPKNLESENCRAGMLLVGSPFTGRHLGFFPASASLQHSDTHWW